MPEDRLENASGDLPLIVGSGEIFSCSSHLTKLPSGKRKQAHRRVRQVRLPLLWLWEPYLGERTVVMGGWTAVPTPSEGTGLLILG